MTRRGKTERRHLATGSMRTLTSDCDVWRGLGLGGPKLSIEAMQRKQECLPTCRSGASDFGLASQWYSGSEKEAGNIALLKPRTCYQLCKEGHAVWSPLGDPKQQKELDGTWIYDLLHTAREVIVEGRCSFTAGWCWRVGSGSCGIQLSVKDFRREQRNDIRRFWRPKVSEAAGGNSALGALLPC